MRQLNQLALLWFFLITLVVCWNKEGEQENLDSPTFPHRELTSSFFTILQDYEIFRLQDELEAAEGLGVTFYGATTCQSHLGPADADADKV